MKIKEVRCPDCNGRGFKIILGKKRVYKKKCKTCFGRGYLIYP
ncbi:MAG: hypothetical protein QXN68_00800 [Thermoplasmata archaeon]